MEYTPERPTHDGPPRPDTRPLLILDLDETLWASTDVHLPYGRSHDIVLRPGLSSFLTQVSLLFRLGVWTAASPDWANAGMDQILAETGHDLQKRAAFIWTRERCATRYDPATQERALCKPLQKVWRSGEFRREKTLAVDDLSRNFACAYGNLITVRPYEGDLHDRELHALGRYLEGIHREPDYRRIEKRGWRQQ